MTESRKIAEAEQHLRRRLNRLKKTRRKIDGEIWQASCRVWDLQYRKSPGEGAR